MFAIKIEKISNSNLDIYFATMSKKYKIPKTKLKKMWLDRNQSYVYKEFNNILRQGKPVLEMLKQLQITEKIVKIDDNYIHEQSGFVFDPLSRKVIGRKNNNGEIQNLTEEDLEDCKQWKFDHIIPLNLDASTHLEKELEQIQLGDDDASDNE